MEKRSCTSIIYTQYNDVTVYFGTPLSPSRCFAIYAIAPPRWRSHVFWFADTEQRARPQIKINISMYCTFVNL